MRLLKIYLQIKIIVSVRMLWCACVFRAPVSERERKLRRLVNHAGWSLPCSADVKPPYFGPRHKFCALKYISIYLLFGPFPQSSPPLQSRALRESAMTSPSGTTFNLVASNLLLTKQKMNYHDEQRLRSATMSQQSPAQNRKQLSPK